MTDLPSDRLASPKTIVTLPSGARVDVNRPDFSACQSIEDFIELKYAISEKIIDIELQIDLYEAVADPARNIDRPLDWLPRAKAALKWAKLYRDEAQNRQGRLSGLEKQRHQAAVDRGVIDIIKEMLPAEKFSALIDAAEALAAKRL